MTRTQSAIVASLLASAATAATCLAGIVYDANVLDLNTVSHSSAKGIDGGQAVVSEATSGSVINRAFVWDGTTLTDLTPAGAAVASAEATGGGQQVGVSAPNASLGLATLWTGSAASAVNLNPAGYLSSAAHGVGGGIQVGEGDPGNGRGQIQPLLWRGTAASVVNLTPSQFVGGEAFGTDGRQQVGYLFSSTPEGFLSEHAVTWTGTPDSAVDLTPGGFDGQALGVSHGQQVGYAGNGGPDHAVLWRGTAASMVDLTPAGFGKSEAYGTNGTQQVGYAGPPSGSGIRSTYAAVWNGSADTLVNLNQFLPALPGELTFAVAYAIDADGNIAGEIAMGNGLDTHAVLWTPRRVPGDATFDGKVDFNDLLVLAQHYGQNGGYVDGDFNHDGTVGFDDLLTLAQNYGNPETPASLAVPEPATGVLLVCAAVLLRRRRPA